MPLRPIPVLLRHQQKKLLQHALLVADDDRTIRTVLTQALTRAGCKVHATSSLTTLMRWIAEGRGDVVITDVMMPDMDGPTLAQRMRQDSPELKIIFISGYTEDRLKDHMGRCRPRINMTD